eukprot:5735490-Pyramimonas_sp.AAC.1
MDEAISAVVKYGVPSADQLSLNSFASVDQTASFSHYRESVLAFAESMAAALRMWTDNKRTCDDAATKTLLSNLRSEDVLTALPSVTGANLQKLLHCILKKLWASTLDQSFSIFKPLRDVLLALVRVKNRDLAVLEKGEAHK